MGLFSKLTREDERLVWGSGYSFIKEKIEEAISSDGFLFILIIGERGTGKSSLALNLLYDIYRDKNTVLRSVLFTVDDYDSLVSKPYREMLAVDGRITAVLWDDMGLHFSAYQWFLPHHQQRLIEFIENFQTVREDIAVVVGTVVEAEMIPPKMRSAVNIMIDCQRRGSGKVFAYSRYLWFKTWRTVGDIHWSRTDESLYKEYRKMKQRAHRAKTKARVLSRFRLAKIYAELIQSLSKDKILDKDMLYGLGIIDKNGRLTPFGSFVINRASIDLNGVREYGEGEQDS